MDQEEIEEARRKLAALVEQHKADSPDWPGMFAAAAELARYRTGDGPVRSVAQHCFLAQLSTCTAAMEALRQLIPLASGDAATLRKAVEEWAKQCRLLERGQAPRWIVQAAEQTRL